jgi:GT2 family glycosyltransferase
MAPQPLVYVIVLAWNHLEETLTTLESLLQSDYANLRVVVVDNASTDGTPAAVRARFPAVEVLESPTNVGISGGYNLGLKHALHAGADYAAVANNDLVTDPAMLANLVAALEADPQAGMAMPKIYHYFGDRTRLWCPGAFWRPFPPEVKMILDVPDGPQFDVQRPIDFAPSCFLLIRRAALERVGVFDTGYFFYYDDWDFSARMRAGGYHILFVPTARLWHMVSISTQKSSKPARWWRVMGESAVVFYGRHRSLAALLVFSAWFVFRETVKGEFGRIGPYLGGLWHGLRAYWKNPAQLRALSGQ